MAGWFVRLRLHRELAAEPEPLCLPARPARADAEAIYELSELPDRKRLDACRGRRRRYLEWIGFAGDYSVGLAAPLPRANELSSVRREPPYARLRSRRQGAHISIRNIRVRGLGVMLVLGTRPEAIKMAPVILECSRRPHDVRSIVCVTGQHREMLPPVIEYFGILPDIDLDLMIHGQTVLGICRAVLASARCRH